MGLNRELREINRQMLTDKQQKQIDRQERQQLKDLQLIEQAQKQHLQLYLKSKIQYYLDLNFNKYKNDLYLLSLKSEIQQDFINKNKEYVDIVFIYFDEFYYKELKNQIKIYEMNQKAVINNTPPVQTKEQLTPKDVIFITLNIFKAFMQVFTNVFIVLIGIFAIFLHPVAAKKRRF